MMTKTYRFYADPSHGWAVVPVKELETFGLMDKISEYSYRKGETAYLEEDCDLSLLVETLKGLGYEVKFKGSSGNKRSRIRNYPRFYKG